MKRKPLRKTAIAAALLSLASLPLTALAAGTESTPTNGASMKAADTSRTEASGTLSFSDRKFIEKAAQGGLAEVEMGKLAQQKAQSNEVRQFGERMVKDHSAADDKLTQIASGKGMTAPGEMDAASKREYDRLSKLSGAEFDREYMKSMVSDHLKDIREFKSQAKSAKDADLRAFAESTVPTLEEHLKLARSADSAAKAEKTASR